MTVWVIADLHLSFGTPNKSMDVFGPAWANHAERVAQQWKAWITPDDLVLIPGDISWGLNLEQALVDLEWIHALPGTKVLLRGNHDYWWTSLSKVQKVLPPSMHLIQNNTFSWNDVVVGGSRLWDTDEYNFDAHIPYQENARARVSPVESAEDRERIFLRELTRLETSLKEMQAKATKGQKRVVMTHYPPIGAELHASRASSLLERYRVDVCLFGHLHNVPPHSLPFGTRKGVRYLLTACDYLNCTPIKLDL